MKRKDLGTAAYYKMRKIVLREETVCAICGLPESGLCKKTMNQDSYLLTMTIILGMFVDYCVLIAIQV